MCKASSLICVVVVVVASARLGLYSVSFQSNFKPFWRYMEVYLQVFKGSSISHAIQSRNSL